ncbi:hypothetical protein BASA62_005031 [Batrachochytrium salamandrivorans]|nr:hypothetical protein BASA62_005031 [Batrachochytrium salamandrivorans]
MDLRQHTPYQKRAEGELHDRSDNSTSQDQDCASQASVYARPFRSVLLPDIFDPAFLTRVRTELLCEEFSLKSNDLYHFLQSGDLKTTTRPSLVTLRETIYSRQFLSFMESITGISLSTTVDLSAHRYPENGYLLCHDDAIGSEEDARRIAFIIYLVEEDWCDSDGGMLQLYNCDDKGKPDRIVRSVVPQWNSMAFFEVLPTSHHEVQQVLCPRDRISISGWFHGPPQGIPPSPSLTSITTHPTLQHWINPTYLSSKSMEAIQLKMCQDSTVELQQFLKPDQYKLLRDAMDMASFDHLLGPANIQRVRVMGDTAVPAQPHLHIIDDFTSMLTSSYFSVYIESITGILLKHQPTTFQLRSFSAGDYTLMHDGGVEPVGIDVVYSCPGGPVNTPWDDTHWSGGMHYIADKETLLSIFPTENTLFVVYRDPGTMRFVKMLTAKCTKTRREMSIVYEESE